ncbi:bone morphogenetic protein 10-like [Lampris incognitus]|uniref:bone morphogenetic protein 10-like n=1 Tax=Lampris incognitus TaxID=2546036 RepID=UPI0024B542BA|nr:bone morphogenetic protein 10-like [Lampris incognitus]
MTVSVFCRFGYICTLSVLLMSTGQSLSSPITPPENCHKASLGRAVVDNPLLEQTDELDPKDLLSKFLSTPNLTEQGPQPRPHAARKEPPEYMLELYNRFANDRTAVPTANIVRSFKNADSSPYSVTVSGVRIHPLLFNISIPHHEHITTAELHLYTMVQRAQRSYAGHDHKVTIYKIREDVLWTKEVRTEGGRSDKEEVVEMKDLEELVTNHIRGKDNSWMSFDLTHVVRLWRRSGCTTSRLEVHIAKLEPEDEGTGLEVTEEDGKSFDVDIDRSLEGKHNAVMIVFSDDRSRDHKQDKQELNQMTEHENDLPKTLEQGTRVVLGHVSLSNDNAEQKELNKQALIQLQSNIIYDTPPRIRRHVKSEPCKRTPLFVKFKEIGWDAWVIQPPGYEAYECNGVCNPPMTSEVSPTKHAIVQTLLSVKRPQRASRACCVPTKLEPISLLYYDNGVATFNHKYEEMVVAECGCR